MNGLNREQLDILRHTKWRAAGGRYCGAVDDANLKNLVDGGYMTMSRAGYLPVTDAYFSLTDKGRGAVPGQGG